MGIRFFLSAKLSGIIDKYLKNNSDKLFEEIQQVKLEIYQIEETIKPLKEEYDKLHFKYFVLFTVEMLHGILDSNSKLTYQFMM